MFSLSSAPHRWSDRLAVSVGIIGFVIAFLFQIAPADGVQIDFLINYSGVRLAWSGEVPYNTALIREVVSNAYPPLPGKPMAEVGFFLTPQSFLVLSPWAILPWPIARWMWVATSALGAVACGCLAWTFQGNTRRQSAGWGIIAAILLLDPLVWRSVSLGQTGLFVAGFIAVGQYARERGYAVAGAILWSVCCLKPHAGLPLLLFLSYQGGIRFAGAVAASAAIQLAAGAALIGDPISVVRSYVQYVGPSHLEIGFNRVINDQLLSWNRLLAAVGGPHFELGTPTTLAGIAFAACLLWAVRIRNRRVPPDAWLLAATTAWTPLVTPIRGYDLVSTLR